MTLEPLDLQGSPFLQPVLPQAAPHPVRIKRSQTFWVHNKNLLSVLVVPFKVTTVFWGQPCPPVALPAPWLSLRPKLPSRACVYPGSCSFRRRIMGLFCYRLWRSLCPCLSQLFPRLSDLPSSFRSGQRGGAACPPAPARSSFVSAVALATSLVPGFTLASLTPTGLLCFPGSFRQQI